MWAVKFLNGDLMGQTFSLKLGVNSLGRGSGCEIVIPQNDISKNHAQVHVDPDGSLRLVDMNSRNGVFINGIKIKTQKIYLDDKITLNKVAFCIVRDYSSALSLNTSSPSMDGESVAAFNPEYNMNTAAQGKAQTLSFQEKFNQFMNEIFLPGLYHLSEKMGMRWSLAVVLLVLTITTCVLSYIPAIQLMNEHAVTEGLSKSKTIAISLGENNRNFLLRKLYDSVNIHSAAYTGAKQLYILGPDKRILAPSNLVGKKPKETFVFSESTAEIYSTTFGSSLGTIAPIKFRDNINDQIIIKGYAVAIFNTKTFATHNSRILSKFIQSLFLVTALCLLGFFFIYKMTEHPLRLLNAQIDQALRDQGGSIESKIESPELQLLSKNISSALNRDSGGISEIEHRYDRLNEAMNITQMMGFPSVAIEAEQNSIICCNATFEEEVGTMGASLQGTFVSDLSDQALRLSIEDLIERSKEAPDQMMTNQLELKGIPQELAIQSVYGRDEISYFIITILPLADEGHGYVEPAA